MQKTIYFIIICLLLIPCSSCTVKDNVDSFSDITSQEKNQFVSEEEKMEVVVEQEHKKELKEELISTAYTTFDPTNTNRKNNIELSGNIISGLVLNPNEEFSFNNIVGERTSDKGFLPAGVFVNSGNGIVTVNSNGGGICQTSSTICMAVHGTSMKIIEQNEHSKRVSYTTRDMEAMINWGTSDFRFINTYDFPVRIEIVFELEASYEIIKCNIYSQKYI